jgi:2-iminobutanoate/2-iminopropanoate deaminase
MSTAPNSIDFLSQIPDGPPAIGPYSPVALSGDFIFVSGQIPYDVPAGKLTRGTIAEQTTCVLTNLGRALQAAGASLNDVISCRVYLSDLTDANFQAMNKVYASFFGEHKPTRTTIGAQLLNFDVEIDAIARKPSA